MSASAINQTVVLTKAQILSACQSAALATLGIDPSRPGLVVGTAVIIEELDIPPNVNYPKASVTITAPAQS